MKMTTWIFLLVSSLLISSLCFSQKDIRSQTGIDSILLLQKQHRLMNLTLWERQQELEKCSTRTSIDSNREHSEQQQPQRSSLLQTIVSDSVNMAWERYYGSRLAAGDDIAKAIAVDSSGNVFVTGTSTTSPYSTEFYTIKYNSVGNEVWHSTYDNGKGTENTPICICVDHSGNIYVTGSSDSENSASDIVTIKYGPDGDTLWVRRYNGTGNFVDYPCTMEIDLSGYVYIVGSSSGLNTESDIVTIKYDSLGNTIWTCRYDGPAHQDDVAADLKVDDSGNVYVAGSSVGLTAYHDYVVIKYTSSGDTCWVSRYDGLGTDEDIATALAVDDSNNVFVTGYSTANNYDYATIKYNAIGEMMWLRRYRESVIADDRAYAIAIDKSGYIYVSGSSYTQPQSSYVTIKYNENGDTDWISKIDASNIGNHAKSITIDTSGNIYLRGDSYNYNSNSVAGRIFKYNSNGNLLWISQSGPENPTAFLVDGSGNTYMTGSRGGSNGMQNFTTHKFDTNGDSIWHRQYDGTGNSHDISNGAVDDGFGNIYVTGISDPYALQSEYVTIKYNAYGDTLWVRRFDCRGHGYNSTINVDGSGNAYVTSLRYNDYMTLKYSPDGELVREYRYDGPGDDRFNATAQVVDKDGNLYVTGFCEPTSHNNYFTTLKHEADGDTAWVRVFSGKEGYSYIARAMTIDDSGNVYVTGSAESTLSSEYVTVKYNSMGDTSWVRYYNGPDNHLNGAIAICSDDTGNVYVTGTSYGLDHTFDYVTIKYDRTGNTLWISRYNSPGNWNDFAKAILPDRFGNIYVTGTSTNSYPNGEYSTIKYTSNGDVAWTRIYRRQSQSYDIAEAMDVDQMGNVYVSGKSYGENGITVSATIKYSSNGDVMRTNLDVGREKTSLIPSSIVVDNSHNIILTGTSLGKHGSEFATTKYIQTPDGVMEQPSNIPGSFSLRQNYPNPFNPITRLTFVIGHSSLVTIKIYDILGKEVATVLADSKYQTGTYEIPFDASSLVSGIYYYRLEAIELDNPENLFTQVKKMILIK